MKRLNLTIWIVVLNLIFSNYARADDFSWALKAPMQQSRSHCASVALNGKIYAIGSYVGGHSGTASVEEYDPATDRWTPKAPISNAVWGLRAAVVNGRIYVFGGANNPGGNSTHFSTVEEYDPAANRWTLKHPMSEAKYNMAIAVFNDKIYIIGGTRGDVAFDTIDEYDPLTDTWTTKTPMPFHRHISYFAQLGDKVYLFGNPTYVYDLATDSWSQRAAPPFDNVGAPAAAVLNGKIYVFGGSFSWGGTGPIGIPDVYEYDPSTDTWSPKTPMATGVALLWQGASVVGNKVYVLGGQTAYPVQSTTLVQEGTLEPGIPTEPPIADAGDDIIAGANETVTLDGSASYDPDGAIVKYTWKRLPDDVVLYSGEEAAYDTKALGRVEEVIELTVTDDSSATATDTLKIISRTTQQLKDQLAALQSQIEQLQQQQEETRSLVDRICSYPPIKWWLRRAIKLGDLNGDGEVNMADFALFTKGWLH